MDTPLLQTKLYIPQPRPDLIARPRLIEQLNEGLHRKLTLISAPAGFGKTTLISEWLGQIDWPVAWLSLDEGDNDLARFLSYLIAALRQLDPKLGSTAQSILQAPQLPATGALMTTLINDLAQTAADFFLVLDDFHLIHIQPVHEAVTLLLNHLPPRMHLVMITRADPPLPLSRLRAQSQMTELRVDDLRFTTEETAAFLNEMIGLTLSADAVAKLEARTEGWITGLQLAGLSMQRQADPVRFINAFAGDDHYIVDYLVEEVLNQQPEETQDFLLQTSILNQMCGPLCDAILGKGETFSPLPPRPSAPLLESAPVPVGQQVSSQEILEYLDQANLFIVPLDNKREWYRYHRLFAELLRNRLQRIRSDLIFTLHRRAGEWYEGNGWINEAVNHALNVEDYDRTAGLVAQNARKMLKQGQVTTLWGWLDKLPQDIVRSNPQLNVALVWARLLTGPFEGFDTVLAEAEQAVINLPAEAVAGRQELLAEVQAIRAIASIEQGDTSPAIIQLARQALDDLPPDDPYLNSALTTSVALAYHANGDTGAAIQSFATAKAIAEQSDNIFSILFAGYELAELYVERGQLRQAETIHRQALSLIEDRFGPGARHIPLSGAAHIGLGKLLYEWNDLESARQHLEQGFDLINQPGGMGFPREASVALAFLHQALGDEQPAAFWIQQAEDMARAAPRPRVMAQVSLRKVRLQLAQNQLIAVQRWMRENALDINQLPDYSAEVAYLTLIRVFLAQGERQMLRAAIPVTTQLLQRAEAQQRWGRAIEISILQALLYQVLGQREDALKALENALSLAEPEGYLRRFMDEGQPMADLLQLALDCKITPGYTRRLLAACKADQIRLTTHSRSQPLVEPLTGRELEVLNLIATGLSNKAIAETLFITVGTVKRHTMNIYGKLGVNSRTQAAVKARELKLIG